ncbi:MAG: 50S ribosomal protein L4 [Atribacterota bacterium]|nr:50S ribosomal protein L4 [Candidatus Atribacteria bacterium]
MDLEVKNREGKMVDSISLDDTLFSDTVNAHVLFLAVKSFLDNQRQGNAKTKTRGEVSGGGKKPWRQKGTGRARQGSNRSPIWKGGGVVFGPRPRSYYHSLPKNEKRVAMINAISQKIQENSIQVIDRLILDFPKTKEAVNYLRSLGLEGKVLFITKENQENIQRAFANIPDVRLLPLNEVNVYELLNTQHVVFEKEALSALQEVLKK